MNAVQGEAVPGGLLFVDKAEGFTSHDVVAKARRALGTRKIGHAGTLDPMATGLLVLGVGPATRLLTHLVGLDKTYSATIRLGQSTVTDDREGELLTSASSAEIEAISDDQQRINTALERLTGDIEQSPSAVSAVKVDGKRAYERVRAGEDVQLKKRPVTIHSLDVHDIRPSDSHIDVDVTVHCSSGTYIRAIARDLGQMLEVGGHLTALHRSHVGPFSVEEAVSSTALAAGDIDAAALVSSASVARRVLPVLQLSGDQALSLTHGKQLELPETANAERVAAIAPNGNLVGVIAVKNARTRIVTNFPVDLHEGEGTHPGANSGETA